MTVAQEGVVALRKTVLRQLAQGSSHFTDGGFRVVMTIISDIDEAGYLRPTKAELLERLPVSARDVESAFDGLKSLNMLKQESDGRYRVPGYVAYRP